MRNSFLINCLPTSIQILRRNQESNAALCLLNSENRPNTWWPPALALESNHCFQQPGLRLPSHRQRCNQPGDDKNEDRKARRPAIIPAFRAPSRRVQSRTIIAAFIQLAMRMCETVQGFKTFVPEQSRIQVKQPHKQFPPQSSVAPRFANNRNGP